MEIASIREICKKYSLSQTALARRFGIPLRTVQDWHGGIHNPPEYVVDMIVKILDMEAKANRTYSVALSNRDCIFDERAGFEHIGDAIAWAAGRGDRYVAHFGIDGSDEPGVSVTCHGDNDYRIYNGMDWERYTALQLAAYLSRNL